MTGLDGPHHVHVLEGECPVCGAKVRLVASHRDHRARWVCGGCRTVGNAPWSIAQAPDAETGRPTASA